jgi:hypothetical protein
MEFGLLCPTWNLLNPAFCETLVLLFTILYNKFTTSVCDGAQVHHRRTTGPGPAKTGLMGFGEKTGFRSKKRDSDFDESGPARHSTVTEVGRPGPSNH